MSFSDTHNYECGIYSKTIACNKKMETDRSDIYKAEADEIRGLGSTSR